MIRLYLERRFVNKFIPHFPFLKLYQRFFFEIDLLFSTFIIAFSIRFKISANRISVISYMLSFFFALFYHIDLYVFKVLSILFFLTVHSWDYADGFVARKNHTEGLLGHIHDEIGGIIVVDIIYFWAGTILLLESNQHNVLMIVIVSMLMMRLVKIKNLFYRLYFLNSPNTLDHNYILLPEIEALTTNLKPSFYSYIKYFIVINDYRALIISVIISEVFNLGTTPVLLIYVFYGLLNTYRMILDVKWTIDQNLDKNLR